MLELHVKMPLVVGVNDMLTFDKEFLLFFAAPSPPSWSCFSDILSVKMVFQ